MIILSRKSEENQNAGTNQSKSKSLETNVEWSTVSVGTVLRIFP